MACSSQSYSLISWCSKRKRDTGYLAIYYFVKGNFSTRWNVWTLWKSTFSFTFKRQDQASAKIHYSQWKISLVLYRGYLEADIFWQCYCSSRTDKRERLFTVTGSSSSLTMGKLLKLNLYIGKLREFPMHVLSQRTAGRCSECFSFSNFAIWWRDLFSLFFFLKKEKTIRKSHLKRKANFHLN